MMQQISLHEFGIESECSRKNQVKYLLSISTPCSSLSFLPSTRQFGFACLGVLSD